VVYSLADTVCIDPVPTTANGVPRETFLLRIAGSINCCMKRRHRRKVVHMLRPFRRPLSQKTGPAIRSSYWLVTAAAGRAAARRIPGLSTYAAAPRIAVFPILADVVEVKKGSGSTAHWSNDFIRLNRWLRNSFAQLITPLDIDSIGQNWEDSNMLTNTGCTALHVLPANDKELTNLNGFVADQFVYMKQGSSSVQYFSSSVFARAGIYPNA